MKIQIFFLLLSFAASECLSQGNKSNRASSNVYHYRNNITLNNFDGTRSTINLTGKSATLFNSDGSQSTINFPGNPSTLIASDGSISSIFENGVSSIISNSDGTQVTVNHMRRSSSCFSANGKHTIRHTFGNVKEIRHKNKIDVLIHGNWLLHQKTTEVANKINIEEPHEKRN